MFNTYRLGHGSFTYMDKRNYEWYYVVGTLLVAEDGTAFRALEVENTEQGQMFALMDQNGVAAYVSELPDTKVIWAPEEAIAV